MELISPNVWSLWGKLATFLARGQESMRARNLGRGRRVEGGGEVGRWGVIILGQAEADRVSGNT